MQFEQLIEYPAYEISQWPYIIRDRETKQIVEQVINKDGYVTIQLGLVTEFLHRIVSVQFNNSKRKYNRRKFEYVESLSEDVIELNSYNGHDFDKYFYDPNTEQILMATRGKYKLVFPKYYGTSCTINLTDNLGHNVNISYFKLLSELKSQIRDGEL